MQLEIVYRSRRALPGVAAQLLLESTMVHDVQNNMQYQVRGVSISVITIYHIPSLPVTYLLKHVEPNTLTFNTSVFNKIWCH